MMIIERALQFTVCRTSRPQGQKEPPSSYRQLPSRSSLQAAAFPPTWPARPCRTCHELDCKSRGQLISTNLVTLPCGLTLLGSWSPGETALQVMVMVMVSLEICRLIITAVYRGVQGSGIDSTEYDIGVEASSLYPLPRRRLLRVSNPRSQPTNSICSAEDCIPIRPLHGATGE